jgi:hypothetical protein
MHRTVLGSIAAAALALPLLSAAPAHAVTNNWSAFNGAVILDESTAGLSGDGSRIRNTDLALNVTSGDVLTFDVVGLGGADTVSATFEVVATDGTSTEYQAIVVAGEASGSVTVGAAGTIELARIALSDAGDDGDVDVSNLAFVDTDGDADRKLYFAPDFVQPVVEKRSVVDDECGYYKIRVGVPALGDNEVASGPAIWRLRINGRLVVNRAVEPGETDRFVRDFREDSGRKTIVVRAVGGGIIDEDVVRTNCRS